MQITYRSTRADWWRCSFWLMTHRGTELGSIVFCLLVGALTAHFVFSQLWPVALLIGIGVALAIVLLTLVTLFAAISGKMLPDGSSAACTTRLGPGGVYDISVTNQTLTPWASVRRIVEGDEDIYIMRPGGSCFIPRSAWVNRQDAKQFFNAANDMLRQARAGQAPDASEITLPSATAEPPSQWPSAPRSAGEPTALPDPLKSMSYPATPQFAVPSFQSKTGTTISPYRAGFILLIGIGFTIFGALDWAKWSRLDSQYHHSPGCTASAGVDPTLTPCTYGKARIYDQIDQVGSHGSHTYKLALTSENRSVPGQTVVVPESFYNMTSVGQVIKAKVWRDDIIAVSAMGTSIATQNDPDRRLKGSQFFCYMGLAFSALGAGLGAYILRQRRQNAATSAFSYAS